VQAGDFATFVILAGSFLRPVGGGIADKIGGYRLLLLLLGGISAGVMIVSSLPPVALVLPVLFLAMGLLGMGNGSVFQIVPQRFPADIELMTGIVGAAGGFGGFLLPSAIGTLKDLTGTFGAGLLCFGLLVLAGAGLLLEFGVNWSARWTPDALRQTRVFCYRMPRHRPAQDGSLGGDLRPAEE